jgi:hypothetical protein
MTLKPGIEARHGSGTGVLCALQALHADPLRYGVQGAAIRETPQRLTTSAVCQHSVQHAPRSTVEPSSASAAGLPGVDLEGVLLGGGCNDRAARPSADSIPTRPRPAGGP